MKPTEEDYHFLLDVTERARQIHAMAGGKSVVEVDDDLADAKEAEKAKPTADDTKAPPGEDEDFDLDEPWPEDAFMESK